MTIASTHSLNWYHNLHRRFRHNDYEFLRIFSLFVCVRFIICTKRNARVVSKTTFFVSDWLCECECVRVCVCVFVLIKLHHSKWAFKEQKLRKMTWFFFTIRLLYSYSIRAMFLGWRCMDEVFRLYQEIGKRIMWNKRQLGSSYTRNGNAMTWHRPMVWVNEWRKSTEKKNYWNDKK